jgi:hypothetical protein
MASDGDFVLPIREAVAVREDKLAAQTDRCLDAYIFLLVMNRYYRRYHLSVGGRAN